MKIHRHEEFGSGCEATCNGPYGGAWSKTMVGYANEITNTALELTYNFGIDSYQLGNDFRYIAMGARDFGARAALGGFNVTPVLPGGYQVVTSPDGYRFLLVPGTDGCNPNDPFLFVSLHVTNLKRSLQYYTSVLGFKVFEKVPGALATPNSAVIGFEESTFKIELVELPPNIPLDHKEGIGRLAIETEDEAPDAVGSNVISSGHKVLHGPFKLPPHSEHVVIVADPDGYEYCFVAQTGYRAGSLSVTNNSINWDYRRKLNEQAKPSHLPTEKKEKSFVKISESEFEGIWKNKNILVIKFSATWCKPCHELAPILEKIALDYQEMSFFEVDYDQSPAICEKYEVDSVPLVIFFKNGSVIGNMKGLKSEEEVRTVFEAIKGK